jgi:DNA-binding transcriptional ArsR family regulator
MSWRHRWVRTAVAERQLRKSDTAIVCGRFDTPVAKSTLSHHFRILREAGIIATYREGGQSLNVLRTPEM